MVDVSLEADKASYLPGDTVNLTVTVNVKDAKGIEIRGVYLVAKSKEATHEVMEKSRTFHQITPVIFEGQNDSDAEKGIPYAHGEHKYTFSFQIMPNMRPTLHQSSGRIRHKVVVYVDRPFHQKVRKAIELLVLPHHVHYFEETYKDPVKQEGKSGKVVVSATLSKGVATVGSDLVIHMHVHNGGSKAVESFKMCLLEESNFWSQNFATTKLKTDERDTHLEDLFAYHKVTEKHKVEKESTADFDLTYKLTPPANHPMFSLARGPFMIQRTFELSLTVEVPGLLSSNIEFRLPLVIHPAPPVVNMLASIPKDFPSIARPSAHRDRVTNKPQCSARGCRNYPWLGILTAFIRCGHAICSAHGKKAILCPVDNERVTGCCDLRDLLANCHIFHDPKEPDPNPNLMAEWFTYKPPAVVPEAGGRARGQSLTVPGGVGGKGRAASTSSEHPPRLSPRSPARSPAHSPRLSPAHSPQASPRGEKEKERPLRESAPT